MKNPTTDEVGNAPDAAAPVTWESLAIQAHFDPQTLAQLCGVSLRTLQRHFRSRHQKTVTEWLRAVRLQQARERLACGCSVKEVAYEFGYKQPSHFTRNFKEHFGVPPSAMIRSKLDSRLDHYAGMHTR